MATSKIYVGDIGTAIVLDATVDISAATARSIEARRPNGVVVSWPAQVSGTNAIQYVATPGDLDLAGAWHLQAVVTLPGGTWRGETVAMQVYAPWT